MISVYTVYVIHWIIEAKHFFSELNACICKGNIVIAVLYLFIIKK